MENEPEHAKSKLNLRVGLTSNCESKQSTFQITTFVHSTQARSYVMKSQMTSLISHSTNAHAASCIKLCTVCDTDNGTDDFIQTRIQTQCIQTITRNTLHLEQSHMQIHTYSATKKLGPASAKQTHKNYRNSIMIQHHSVDMVNR